MINFTRSLALEFASRGLRANCVAPGGIQTPLIAGFIPREDFEPQLVAYYSPPQAGPAVAARGHRRLDRLPRLRRGADDQRRGPGVRRRDVGVRDDMKTKRTKDQPERRRSLSFVPSSLSLAMLITELVASTPRTRGAHRSFATRAGSSPTREFERLTNRAAHAFAELGVRKGDRVTLGMGNSVEYLVAAFGVLEGRRHPAPDQPGARRAAS